MSDPKIGILLVDDHEMFREGLARMLEKEPGFAVVGQARSATEALDQAVPAHDCPARRRSRHGARHRLRFPRPS